MKSQITLLSPKKLYLYTREPIHILRSASNSIYGLHRLGEKRAAAPSFQTVLSLLTADVIQTEKDWRTQGPRVTQPYLQTLEARGQSNTGSLSPQGKLQQASPWLIQEGGDEAKPRKRDQSLDKLWTSVWGQTQVTGATNKPGAAPLTGKRTEAMAELWRTAPTLQSRAEEKAEGTGATRPGDLKPLRGRLIKC